MHKEYSLITNEPLSEFDQSVLAMLNGVSELGTPKAMVGAVIMNSGEVMTFYHNAEFQDILLAKGHLELDIMNDNTLGNLPWFVEQARKEGLIDDWGEDEDYEEEDSDG